MAVDQELFIVNPEQRAEVLELLAASETVDIYELPEASKAYFAELLGGEEATDVKLAISDAETDKAQAEVIGCAKRSVALEYKEEALQREIQRLQARLSSVRKAKDWARAFAFRIMLGWGFDKVKRDGLTVSLTTQGEKLEVTDVEAIPESCYRIKKEPDMAALKKWWKDNEKVPPGCKVVEERQSLGIRK